MDRWLWIIWFMSCAVSAHCKCSKNIHFQFLTLRICKRTATRWRAHEHICHLMAEEKATVFSGQTYTNCCCKELWPLLYTFLLTVVYLQLVVYETLQYTVLLQWLLIARLGMQHLACAFLFSLNFILNSIDFFYIYYNFSCKWYVMIS